MRINNVTYEAIIQNHFKRPTYGIVIVRLMDLPRGALGDFQYSTFSSPSAAPAQLSRYIRRPLSRGFIQAALAHARDIQARECLP